MDLHLITNVHQGPNCETVLQDLQQAGTMQAACACIDWPVSSTLQHLQWAEAVQMDASVQGDSF